jgi:hypothetical protein
MPTFGQFKNPVFHENGLKRHEHSSIENGGAQHAV